MKPRSAPETLDIPEVLEIPDPAPDDLDVIATADFLMTALLHRLPAMLHAEFQDGEGRWFIRNAERNDTFITQLKTVGEFRALLARFGHHYMDGQLYGGHISRSTTQNGRKYACEIFMSNRGLAGYWIRVYAHEIAA